jgi:HD-like signal output (HDOD) protein
MAGKLWGQLFGRGSAEVKAKPPVRTTGAGTSGGTRETDRTTRPEHELVFLDPFHDAPPPAPTDLLIASLGLNPETAASPDAEALLALVAEGPEAMIRQLPAAAQSTLAICDDPNLTRRQLADSLAEDPALVQALLRCANSAAYGAGKDPVISIAPALDRVGMAGTRSLIFSNAIDGVLSRPGGEFDAIANDVWQHMVRTAPIARILAPVFSVDPDEAFSIALLHDVGKLVIFDRISVLRTRLRRTVKLTPGFARAMLMELHEPLGAMAATAWGMGDRSARAIGFHHRHSSDGMPNTLAEVVFVAEAVDHAIRRNARLDLKVMLFDGKVRVDQERLAPLIDGMGVKCW